MQKQALLASIKNDLIIIRKWLIFWTIVYVHKFSCYLFPSFLRGIKDLIFSKRFRNAYIPFHRNYFVTFSILATIMPITKF